MATFLESTNSDYVGRYPMTNDDPTLAGTERPHTPYQYKTDSYLVSFFGRANYTLMDKYLFTFTMRADGSSKFAKGSQWGYFPSGAIAWRIYDEAFMNNAKEWLSNLKLA